MFDHQLQQKTKIIQHKVATNLKKYGLTANQLTFFGFFLAALSFISLLMNYYLVALVFILLNRIVDGLDGALARITQPTDRGGFLDIILDFLFYSSVPLGFAFADPANNALAASLLIYSFIGTGCSFLAFAVIAEKRRLNNLNFPNKSFYYLGGLTESGETVFVFVLMCLFPNQFNYLAYFFAMLCLMSTFLRIHAGWNQFKD